MEAGPAPWATISRMAGKATSITLREAAARLGVHESTVRRYADRGLIDAVRLPSGVRRLRSADVERLAARRPDGAPVPSLEELAAEQNIRPLVDVGELAAPRVWESDEEVERFIAMTRAERDRDR